MTYETLLTDLEAGIFTITLNRPDRLHALTGTMLTELLDVLDEVDRNDELRLVIVTRAGPRVGAVLHPITHPPKTRPRTWGGKAAVRIAMLAGCTTPAPRPWMIRATIKASRDQAKNPSNAPPVKITSDTV